MDSREAERSFQWPLNGVGQCANAVQKHAKMERERESERERERERISSSVHCSVFQAEISLTKFVWIGHSSSNPENQEYSLLLLFQM